MLRKGLLALGVPTVALIVAVAALAFVPGFASHLSRNPAAFSIPAPSWAVGDAWTYNVSLASMAAGDVLPPEMTPPTLPVEAYLHGTVAERVASSVSTAEGDAWNVTLSGDLSLEPPRPIVMDGPVVQGVSGPNVTWSGFAWVRQSDLALIYSLKTMHLERNWTLTYGTWDGYGMLANGTYTLTYDATLSVAYAPALTVWRFPLQENVTWNVTSNASVDYASTFQILGPNVTYASHHAGNFTVPVAFTMQTGMMGNATTPAGTFDAIPVSATRKPVSPKPLDPEAAAVLNLTGETDLDMPRAFATAWFSAQAGNLVKATYASPLFDGPRLEMDIVSYTYG